MTTKNAYLAVADHPRRVLSPLLENVEENEEEELGEGVKPPSLEEFLPPPPKEAFVSPAENNNSLERGSLVNGRRKSSGEDITLDISLDDNCFIGGQGNGSEEDDFLSDDSLSINDDDDFDTDLEVDTEEWLNPRRTDHDTTGRTKYIKVCNDMGISPVSYFVKNLEQKELKMRFHGLGPLGLKAISIPLETNTNIEILNLEGNGIDATGAKSLCRVLRENLFLTELVLRENKLNTEGAIQICQFLKSSRNLVKVDLNGNKIGDAAGQSFYEVLKENPVLKELLLSNNCLEENSAKWFREALIDNDTLELLDLSWNQFKTRGAVMIVDGLKENVGLKRLKLVMAGLGKPGAEGVATALKYNRTLLNLDISYNRIPMEGAHAIALGIKENDTLKTLKIGNNPFDSDGAFVLLQAVDQNDSSAISYLDFSNIMVKIEFADLEKRLSDTRQLRVVNEGVLPEMCPMKGNNARLSAFRRDPIETFKKYAEFSNVKLENVFNVKTRTKIDADEFKLLIKGSGIDIPDQHMSFLIRALEENDCICYWKIFENDSSNKAINFGDNGNVGDAKNKLRSKSASSSASTDKPKSARPKKKKEKKKK